MKHKVLSIHLIAPIPAINRRTRVNKQVDVLLKHGHNVTLLGWERLPGESCRQRHSDPRVTEQMILHGGGYASRLTHLFYVFWMVRVFFKVLFLPRHSALLCLGFESAFPALLASKFTGAKILFDDADRFSMILALPRPFNNLIQAVEKWTSKHCTVHIVPGMTRYNWTGGNMAILRNTPNLADFELALAKRLHAALPEFVLYANGWIGETRGAPVFLALMRKLAVSGPQIKLRLIGRGDGSAYDILKELPNVIAMQEVPQIEALAAYCTANLVLTYYDPKVPINRQAESNKWGDCIFLGVPFIVNSEVETAAKFVEEGAAFSVPYADVDALEALILHLQSKPSLLADSKKRLQNFRSEYLPFDNAFEKILLAANLGTTQSV